MGIPRPSVKQIQRALLSFGPQNRIGQFYGWPRSFDFWMHPTWVNTWHFRRSLKGSAEKDQKRGWSSSYFARLHDVSRGVPKNLRTDLWNIIKRWFLNKVSEDWDPRRIISTCSKKSWFWGPDPRTWSFPPFFPACSEAGPKSLKRHFGANFGVCFPNVFPYFPGKCRRISCWKITSTISQQSLFQVSRIVLHGALVAL